MNIDYPFHFDHRGRTASVDDAGHIRDMIEQILFTAPGERVNRPEFGSGIQQMVFAPNSVEMAGALEFTLRAALQQWLGDRIQVHQLQVEALDAYLTVVVEYSLVLTGERQRLETRRNVA